MLSHKRAVIQNSEPNTDESRSIRGGDDCGLDGHIEGIQYLWNQVNDEGESFFWTESFSREAIEGILKRQDAVYCAVDTVLGSVAGFYILHGNFPGRGKHIANALYAVRNDYRGRGIGKLLGLHSLDTARELGYRAMQFNSVVSTNVASIRLWESLGIERVGTVKEAFMKDQGVLEDIHIFSKRL